MPRPLSWLPRLAEIRRSVTGSVRAYYDRPAIETLFQVQPRAAGKLMALLPRSQALGRSHLVEREQLGKFLDAMAAADDTAGALAQWKTRDRKVSRRRPRIQFRRALLTDGTLAALPDNVVLERGRLEIRFATLQQMVESLAMIAGSLANDEELFCAAYEPMRERTEAQLKAEAEREDMRRMFEELREMEARFRAELDTKAGHLVRAL